MDSRHSAVNSSTNTSTSTTIFGNTRSTYDNQLLSIPASLMIPPLTVSTTCTTVSSSSHSEGTTASSSANNLGNTEIKELHQDLGSMQANVVREVEVLQDLHRKLSIKAHEMDRLKTEISQLERNDHTLHLSKAVLTGEKGSATVASHPRVASSSCTGLQTPYSSNANPLVEEFRTRLQMTTELCAKQDTYYRDIIKELEERLKETIQGRDHILALRDKEANDQVSLMRQLENALRTQQQLTAAKFEDIEALEIKLEHTQNNYSSLLSVFGQLSQVLINHEKRKGKNSLLENKDGKEFTSHMGDALLQTLQKCLFDDSSAMELLSSKLEKASIDMKELESEMKRKLQDTKAEYDAKLENMKKNSKEASEAAALQYTKTTEKLCNAEQQLELTIKQHSVEVSGLMEKVNALQKELDSVCKQKNDITSEFEKKTSDLDLANHSITVELKLLRQEKEKLLSNLSQEQANVITLKNKLMEVQDNLKLSKEETELLSKEKDQNELNLKKEVEHYRVETERYKTLLLERERGLSLETEKEVQNAIRSEQSKADERINIVLYELKKVNNEVLTLKNDNEALEKELNGLNIENKVMKDNLEKTDKELTSEKEEKLNALSKLDGAMKEGDRLHNEIAAKVKDLDEKSKEIEAANVDIAKMKVQLDEREKTIASFREQDGHFAEILQRNTQAGDVLHKEREDLLKKVQEQAADVQEMKKHREILAKKLKAKDKKLKEIEEQNVKVTKSMEAKTEELAALMDDRNQIISELKTRQQEVVNLRQERDSLSNLLQGKDGEREKEIGKLLSRLKGSEQDLCLTKKLLKSKGDVSGKAVRVAESMQREVTEKRGEMDALLSKIHWLQENLNAAVKDKMYFESKSSKMSDELHQAVILRDKFQFELQQKSEECNSYLKQVGHLEQALEKAALKYADSRGVIEKLEQDCARLKLKHSLELKDCERNVKTSTTKVDSQTIAEVLARISAMNTRLPLVTSQIGVNSTSTNHKAALVRRPITLRSLKPSPQEAESKALQASQNNEVQQDLKSLLLDVRTLISSFHSHVTKTPTKHYGPQNGHFDVESYKIPTKDLGNDVNGTENLTDSELDISLDIDDCYHGNIRPPLRSSSPMPEPEVSITTSRQPSPSNNDSFVTSLLSFTTAVSSDDQSDRISSLASNKQHKVSENTGTKKGLSKKKNDAPLSKTKTAKDKFKISKSGPSYEKAEEMLRSLAQTGSRLTKKNKEISSLLNEQERRIQQCRENELDINSLLP